MLTMMRPTTILEFRRLLRLLATFVLLVGAVSCSSVEEDARYAELAEWLVDDNRAMLEREPELTRMKYLVMASSPYSFLRGTASLFARDLSEAGAWPTQYATHESSLVLILGDAHPENIGAYQTESGTLLLDYNDFDGAGYGPWHFEVRRLALSTAVSGLEALRSHDELAIERAATLAPYVVQGYVDELRALLAGEEPIRVRRGAKAGTIANEIFDRAQEDGADRAELKDFTEIVDGVRRLRTGALRIPTEGYYSRELWEVSAEETAMIEEVLRQWEQTTITQSAERFHGAPLIDVRRRVGKGVGSYPVLRYYALLQGPTGDVDDVVLLDIKEARDGISFPGVVFYDSRRYGNNAERSIALQRAFQEDEASDPMLGWGSLGAMAFRVQRESDYQKGNDVARMSANYRSGEWDWSDIEDFAVLSGRMLARGHALAPTAHGRLGLDVIAEAIDGDFDGFVEETSAFVADYLPMFVADYERFQRLLEEEGPFAGYRPLTLER